MIVLCIALWLLIGVIIASIFSYLEARNCNYIAFDGDRLGMLFFMSVLPIAAIPFLASYLGRVARRRAEKKSGMRVE